MSPILPKCNYRYLNLYELREKYGEDWRSKVKDIIDDSSRAYIEQYMGYNVSDYTYRNFTSIIEKEEFTKKIDKEYLEKWKKDSESYNEIASTVRFNRSKDNHKVDIIINNNTAAYYVNSPTGNCQLGSIIYFNNLLSNVQELSNNKIQMVLSQLGAKPLVFVDVNTNCAEYLKDYDFIQPPMHYISSNGSKMVCGIFRNHGYVPVYDPTYLEDMLKSTES